MYSRRACRRLPPSITTTGAAGIRRSTKSASIWGRRVTVTAPAPASPGRAHQLDADQSRGVHRMESPSPAGGTRAYRPALHHAWGRITCPGSKP